MDCSLPGSSVHGILQARILEWVAVSFTRWSSQPRNWTQVSKADSSPSESPGKPIDLCFRNTKIIKSRDITLPTKVRLVKATVFPVVMYGCESWTIKKAECRRIDAFELWCGRRVLRVPWIARRSNQSILKEISPGCSLEGLMLKLKLQYFGCLIWKANSLEKAWCWERLKAG